METINAELMLTQEKKMKCESELEKLKLELKLSEAEVTELKKDKEKAEPLRSKLESLQKVWIAIVHAILQVG